MRRYETIVILDPDLSEDQRSVVMQRTKEVVPQQGGLLAFIDEWGAKHLAYEIKKKERGYYVRFDYCGTGAVVDEMERFYRIDDRVLKYMTVLTDEAPDIDSVKAEIEAAESEKVKAAELAEAEKKAAAEKQAQAEKQTEAEIPVETEVPAEAKEQADAEIPVETEIPAETKEQADAEAKDAAEIPVKATEQAAQEQNTAAEDGDVAQQPAPSETQTAEDENASTEKEKEAK